MTSLRIGCQGQTPKTSTPWPTRRDQSPTRGIHNEADRKKARADDVDGVVGRRSGTTLWQLGRQIVWPIITQSTLEVEQGTMIFAMMDEASADDDDDHHLVDIPHHLLRQNHHRGGVTIVELLGARQVHHFILIWSRSCYCCWQNCSCLLLLLLRTFDRFFIAICENFYDHFVHSSFGGLHILGTILQTNNRGNICRPWYDFW